MLVVMYGGGVVNAGGTKSMMVAQYGRNDDEVNDGCYGNNARGKHETTQFGNLKTARNTSTFGPC